VSNAFSFSAPLRFAHCDAAGIGYYPCLLELCDAAIEDWTEAVLQVPRRVLHCEMQLALPTVRMNATFVRPSRLGDRLDFKLTVDKFGRSSVDLLANATSNGELRFSIDFVQVLTCMTTMRPKPWPDEWRMRLGAVLNKEKQC
jgi:4-hydroxybenzoyl-CoA thioesterase